MKFGTARSRQLPTSTSAKLEEIGVNDPEGDFYFA